MYLKITKGSYKMRQNFFIKRVL